jgi:hypothetical protein
MGWRGFCFFVAHNGITYSCFGGLLLLAVAEVLVEAVDVFDLLVDQDSSNRGPFQASSNLTHSVPSQVSLFANLHPYIHVLSGGPAGGGDGCGD